MMKCLQLVGLAVLMSFSTISWSAGGWIPSLDVPANAANADQFLTIESYRYYWNGYNAILTVKFKEPINTGCATADSGRLLSYWANPSNNYHSAWLSIVIAAKAQGQKVRVLHNSACSSRHVGGGLRGIEPLILD